MPQKPTTIAEYLAQIPQEHQEAINKLRKAVTKTLPQGFKEELNYGMIGYVVPHTVYPKGYHCDPKLPLPFANIASRKSSVNFYHSGLYASQELLKWFQHEYPKHCDAKLDMGKSCIRFKKLDAIPYGLISQLMSKISVQEWIERYETTIKSRQTAK